MIFADFIPMNSEPGFRYIADQVYDKRDHGQPLEIKDLIVLLADTLLDHSFFKSPRWNYQYGGIRYTPGSLSINDPRKILVMQWPAAIGDTAMAASFFSLLRNKYPCSEIYFLSNKTAQNIYGASSIVDHYIDNPLNVFLDQIAAGQRPKLQELIPAISYFVKILTIQRFDLCINLQILPQSAVLTKMVQATEVIGMTLTEDGMPVILGNVWAAHLFGTSAGLMRRFNPLHRNEIFRLMIGDETPPPLNPASLIRADSIDSVQKRFDASGIEDQDRVIGLFPMATWPTRIWPRFDKLAKMLEDRFNAKILMFGSQDDDAAITGIVESSKSSALKIANLDLNELMAAICGCDLIITNDTGPMHLASLLKQKVVALMGSTSIREVGPWQSEFVVLQSDQCRECYKETCDKADFCMDHITVEDVVQAADALIDSGERKTDLKVSENVSWYSNDHTHTFLSDVEAFIARIHYFALNKFIPDNQKQLSDHLKGNIPDSALKFLENMCNEAIPVLKETVSKLNKNGRELCMTMADRHLNRYKPYLKHFTVLNSMKYLDKRAGANTMDAYKKYYSGLLHDIECLLSIMQAFSGGPSPKIKKTSTATPHQQVLILCNGYPPHYYGGESIYNLHLADALVKDGYRVTIINPIRIPIKNEQTVKSIHPQPEISLYQIRINDGETFAANADAAILDLVDKINLPPDIIHCSTNVYLGAVEILKRRFQTLLIYTINSMDSAIIYDVLTKKNGNRAVDDLDFHRREITRAKKMCETSDLVMATTNAMASSISKHYGVHRGKIRMVYNGTDIEKFAAGNRHKEIARIKETLHISDNETVILFAGRMEPSKGVLPLAQAALSIVKSHARVSFIFIGNGSLDEDLKSMLSGHQNIHFIGWIGKEEIAAYFHLADVVVMPSLLEPFGRVAVESMASRSCIITSDADGLNEIVDHEINGIKIPIRHDRYGDRSLSHEQITEAIESVIINPQRMKMLVENAYHKSKTFDLSYFEDGVRTVYGELKAGLIYGG